MLTHAVDVTCLSYHSEFQFVLQACLLMSSHCLNTPLELINPENNPCVTSRVLKPFAFF